MGESSFATRKLMGWPLVPAYWGVKVRLIRFATGVQLLVVTPVMAKGAVVVTEAGFTVMVKLVLTLKLPGSVAVTVTVDTPDAEGVPLMTLPLRLSPPGKPLALKVSVWPSGSLKEGATLRLNAWPTVAFWLAIPVVVGAWLVGGLTPLQAANQL